MLIHNALITGSLSVNGTGYNTGSFSGSFIGAVAGTTATASYVEYNSVANKPTLVSGSSQITYSGLTGIPSGIVSGSSQVAALGFASTGSSNTFQASQTITGSLFITQNLVVAGSSSIQYISSSVLDIADNIITVNAFNPGVRFGGLAVIDSGSSPQVSGSLLFDSIKDQWIFVHQNQAVVTSSVVLMGPETYNDPGNESYISANRLPKGSGVEHLRDSNITDTGTVVSVNSNTQVTGSLVVTSTGTFSSSVTAGSNVLVPAGSGLAWSGDASRIITPEDNVQGAKIATPGGFLVEASVFKFIGGNVGIGTPSPSSGLELGSGLDLKMPSNGNIIFGNSNVLIYKTSGQDGLSFNTGGSEKMRITSGGNVLIGTTTDNGARLQVNGAGGIRVNEDGSGTKVISIRSDFAGVDPAVNVATNNSLLLMTNNTERMRITSGGNIEIGTTGFSSPSGADRFIGVYGAQDSSLILQDNVQTWELYVNDDFYINRGSTNVLTLNRTTGAATLLSDDGSGNRTTVNDVLTITQTNPNSPYSGFGSGLLFRGTTYNGGGSGSPGVRNWGRIVMQLTDSSISTTGENMIFQVASADNSDTLTTALTLAYNGAATFASTITSTGAAFSGNLDLSGAAEINHTGRMLFDAGAGNGFLFRCDNVAVTAMTIQSDGVILSGTTNDGFFNGSVTGTGIYGSNGFIAASRSSNTCAFFNRFTSTGDIVQFRYAGSNVGTISTNGSTITFSGNALSDERFKENIEPIENALDTVNKIEFKTFNYKENQQYSAGVTAQQLQTVDELSKYVIDGTDEESYKAVDYNALIGYLGKAIQELKTELDTAKTEIQLLKQQ